MLRKCYFVCFGTDVLDPEGQNVYLYLDGPSFARDLFSLKILSGGGGYRRTTRRALFLEKTQQRGAAACLIDLNSKSIAIAGVNPRGRFLQRRERKAEVDCPIRIG